MNKELDYYCKICNIKICKPSCGKPHCQAVKYAIYHKPIPQAGLPDVKRYSLIESNMVEYENGKWVKHEDYERIRELANKQQNESLVHHLNDILNHLLVKPKKLTNSNQVAEYVTEYLKNLNS